MNILKKIKLISILGLIACGSQESQDKGNEMHKYTNRLIDETSPYLLQHAHNPVDWYPWSDEAFEKARQEDKPVFLSIGYSSCHWCHVMEDESFENEEIAALMNELFICIKVDREERPDVDQLYMQYVQMTTGSGGWPMSVFLTPEQKPFFGGTYFPPEDRYGRPGFKRILTSLSSYYHNEKTKLQDSIEKVNEAFHQTQILESADSNVPVRQDWDYAIEQLSGYYEPVYGGIGKAPKFPAVQVFNLFLRAYKISGEQQFLNMVKHTLDNMAKGGIYDQIGGGFSRYSVDDEWLVPHFEKMLYDNGQLVQLYIDTYLVTKDEFYLNIAEETLDFVLRELTAPWGGFYSSLDADSEGEEGKFYVWTQDEIKQVLGEQNASIFNAYYGVTPFGNFEGKTILHMAKNLEELVTQFNLPEDELREIIQAGRKKLLDERAKRIRPGLDDKIITSWNALMLSGFARAYQVTGNEKYRDVIQKNISFLHENLYQKGVLKRTYKDNIAKYDAFIEDYSFLINALLDSYEALFDPDYITWAAELLEYTNTHFLDSSMTVYYTTSDQQSELIYRLKDTHDSSIPSGTGIMLMNNLRFFSLTEKETCYTISENILTAHSSEIRENPYGYASFLNVLDFFLEKPKEILVVKKPSGDVNDFLNLIFNNYFPNKVVIILSEGEEYPALTASLIEGKKVIDNKSTAYVCQNFQCSLPVFTEADLKKLLQN